MHERHNEPLFFNLMLADHVQDRSIKQQRGTTMRQVYEKIWVKARPFYEKGRPMDIDHIGWMMEEADRLCEEECLEDRILLPLVILHDVGYARVPKDNPFNMDIRRAHMEEGAKIAKEILDAVGYEKEKTSIITYFVSMHDNWALDDIEVYQRNKLLWIFTDLDFIWMATPKGFDAVKEIQGKTGEGMIEYLESTEKPAKPIGFASEATEKIFNRHLAERKMALKLFGEQRSTKEK